MSKMPKAAQVTPSYRHYEKEVRSHGAIGSLKWYDINRSNKPVDQTIRDLAQSFISRTLTPEGSPSPRELGFVLLHRCGEGFYFLGLCAWRGNNELWKTQFFFEDGTMEDFALFPQDKTHKDTFCIWELAVVCHETQAWTTYLTSTRTDQDTTKYLATVI